VQVAYVAAEAPEIEEKQTIEMVATAVSADVEFFSVIIDALPLSFIRDSCARLQVSSTHDMEVAT
jgi:hypothetical protein